jgi:hypothetical protein
VTGYHDIQARAEILLVFHIQVLIKIRIAWKVWRRAKSSTITDRPFQPAAKVKFSVRPHRTNAAYVLLFLALMLFRTAQLRECLQVTA